MRNYNDYTLHTCLVCCVQDIWFSDKLASAAKSIYRLIAIRTLETNTNHIRM